MSVVHDNDDFTMDSDINDHIWNGDSIDVIPSANGYNFTGIDPYGIAQNGQEIVICNESSDFSFTLTHDDINSADGNRFFFPDNLNHVLDPYVQVWGVRREDIEDRIGWWMQF